MTVTPRMAAVPFLLLLLTWLSWRAINPDAERFDRSHAALDHFAMVENALYRDVLTARTGMLRNYDPLVRDVNALYVSLDRLRGVAPADAELVASLDQLATLRRLQDEMIEQFKSDNALLQNSLAYFGLFSVNLSASDHDGPFVQEVSALAAAMLHFTLDTSPDAAREVEMRLNALSTRDLPAGKAESAEALLAHGRLLFKLLPATDEVLRSLFAVPTKQDEHALRAMILTRQKASRDASRVFRILVYGTSLLLLAILVQFGLQLRRRARALQRRAALEHVIAGISTRFINSQPHEIAAHVEQALGELGESLDASRAYFVLAGAPSRVHVWCAEGITCPPGWPRQALALSPRLAPAQGAVHIPSVDRLSPGDDRESLAAAGVRSWTCVATLRGDEISAILGFDAADPHGGARGDDLGLMRMALDAIANAVRRALLEQEKGRLEQQLARAQRMETVGALTSGIAHNFNNIVGAILGYAEMADAKAVGNLSLASDIGEIRRAGELGRDLVDQILTFGRPRDARRSPVSAPDLIAEAASLFRASAPPDVELVVREASGQAIVSGDRAQLQQVLLNLCNNAAQAMDGCGRVEVEIDIHEIAQGRPLSHGSVAPGRYMRIAVIDAGRGMDDAVLRHIFEPFFTTRKIGNGLGLATAREIVREHGGAMNVATQPGAGTRIEAWMPCIVATILPPDDHMPALPFGRGETLLVLDEDRDELLRYEEILAALGYEPVGFARPGDALAAWKAAPQRFDAMVVSHLGPAAPMLRMTAIIHNVAPNAPVVLATRSADEIGADALVAAGVREVVRLPFIAIEIAVALKRCLAASRKMSSGASAS